MQSPLSPGRNGEEQTGAAEAAAAAAMPAHAPAAAAATLEQQHQQGVDAALVRRAADGDVRAFGSLVERYQRPMTALVARMTENADDVDDIVQEVFVRAWRGLPRFRGDAQFSTWLYRIAVNTTIKHRSRRKHECSVSLSTEDIAGGLERLNASDAASGGTTSAASAATDAADPFTATARKEREEVIRRAVLALPEKQRAVVVLHYFEGYSCEEISKMVGCSLGTVWSRLHYACKRLKGILGPAGEEETA